MPYLRELWMDILEQWTTSESLGLNRFEFFNSRGEAIPPSSVQVYSGKKAPFSLCLGQPNCRQ